MCLEEQENNFISKFDLLSVGTGFDHMVVGEIVNYVPLYIMQIAIEGNAGTKWTWNYLHSQSANNTKEVYNRAAS